MASLIMTATGYKDGKLIITNLIIIKISFFASKKLRLVDYMLNHMLDQMLDYMIISFMIFGLQIYLI